MQSTRRVRLLLGALVLAAASLARPASAVDPVNTDLFGNAVKGYDVVAYFEEGRPVKGDPEFSYDWMGATWRFSSADHRDRFALDPERYAPRYGGYCAYAVSQGTTADIDPDAWKIVDDRLYLNLSPQVQRLWEKDVPGHIEQADAHWPGLLAD